MRQNATRNYLEKGSGERNVDSGPQVQINEDGGCSSCMTELHRVEWSVAYDPVEATKHKSSEVFGA